MALENSKEIKISEKDVEVSKLKVGMAFKDALPSVVYSGSITLDQAIQMALENSKEIKISEKDVEVSKLKVGMAFKDALPSVVYSGSYTRGEYERPMKRHSWEKNQVDRKGGYTQTITISQPIFQGGAVLGGIKGAQAYKNISNLLYMGEGMAFKDALPSVVYSGSYTRGEYERPMKRHSWEKNQVDRKGGYTQTITISQPIFQGGAVLGGIKGAQAYKKISNLLYMGERRDVRLETILNYSNIVKFEKDLEALEASHKELKARYEKQKAQLDLRLITKTDILKTEYSMLEVDLEALEASHKELKARYEKQKAQLDLRLITKTDILKTEYSMLEVESQIIGTKNRIEIEKEKLRIKTGLVNDKNIEVVEFTVPENLSRNIDFSKDKHQALTESIGALTAKYYVDAADASKMISRADMLPKVNAFASYGTSERTKYNPTIDEAEWRGGVQVTWNVFEFGISRADMLPKVNAFASYGTSERTKYNPTIDEAEWRGGVQVTWNVFEFGKNYDNYRVASITKEQEELREKSSKDNIGVNVTDAYLELIRMEKERSSKERAMEAAVENFKMDQERYDAGSKDNIGVNVTDAYLELIRMEKERSSKERAMEAAVENFKMDQERYDAGLISTVDFLLSETQMREAKVAYNQVVVDYLYAFEKYRSMLI